MEKNTTDGYADTNRAARAIESNNPETEKILRNE